MENNKINLYFFFIIKMKLHIIKYVCESCIIIFTLEILISNIKLSTTIPYFKVFYKITWMNIIWIQWTNIILLLNIFFP